MCMKNLLYSVVFIMFLLAGCDIMDTKPSADEVLISPYVGLNEEELAKHLEGDAVFNKSFTKEEGVGPVFIATTCRSCHFNGGKGHPFNEIIRFGNWDDNGHFTEMLSKSGPQLQYRSIDGYPEEEVPEDADGVVHLNPPALGGLGFLEAIADENIISWADPDDINDDGISGRVPYVHSPTYTQGRFISDSQIVDDHGEMIGKFGKKSFSVNLFQQAARALNEDLGMTTSAENHDPFNWRAPKELREIGDGVPNPEVSDKMLEALTFFLRSTAPPPRRDVDNPNVIEGEKLFISTGCVKCHRDSFTTGNTSLGFLNNKVIHPYTDMLLHDMGPGLDDGYTEGDAETYEWRTPPLWGLGLAEESQGGNGYYMHDGRALTLYDAIQAHGGEATHIKEKYNELNIENQNKLIAFLRSL